MTTFALIGRVVETVAAPATPLLWVIPEQLVKGVDGL
ncbi:hypothetical protein L598_005300000140 [Mesorhizobium sp. J18]|jgi:hypothetical protein|nr:hypothetical protein L598_005300000140 [Mesorhizobium sp. J18]